MSFLNEHKLLFGAVGIALSSAAAGYVSSRTLIQRSSFDTPLKVLSEGSPVAKYVLKHGIREPSPLVQLRQATLNHPKNEMICSADEAQFMRLLLQLIKAKKVIEIGVYTGYNTLSMAVALPPYGKVVACDITDKFLREADSHHYFKEAGVESKIDLRMQPAIATLDELINAGESGTFDLVFIDADRISKDKYYEKSLQLLRKGGLVVIDNVLCDGKVCDPEERAANTDLKAPHDLNVKVHEDSRVLMSLIPIADGVTIAMKL